MTLFFDTILIPLAIATLLITALCEWEHRRLKAHHPPCAWRLGALRGRWPSLGMLRRLQGRTLTLTTLALGGWVIARSTYLSWTLPTDLALSLGGLCLASLLLTMGWLTTWGLRHVSLCEGALFVLLLVSRALI